MTPATFNHWLLMALNKNLSDFCKPETEWVLKAIQHAADKANILMKGKFPDFFPEEEPSDG